MSPSLPAHKMGVAGCCRPVERRTGQRSVEHEAALGKVERRVHPVGHCSCEDQGHVALQEGKNTKQ